MSLVQLRVFEVPVTRYGCIIVHGLVLYAPAVAPVGALAGPRDWPQTVSDAGNFF